MVGVLPKEKPTVELSCLGGRIFEILTRDPENQNMIQNRSLNDFYGQFCNARTCCVAVCTSPLQTDVVTAMLMNCAAVPVAPPIRPGCLTAASRLTVVCGVSSLSI